MDVWVLDNEFKSMYLIDSFQSLVWTENYMGYGDFELFMPINPFSLQIVNFIRSQRKKELDSYLLMRESDQVMIVEAIEMSTDADSGARMKFSGRSLESIIERRIVWRQTIFNSTLQHAVQRLLNENLISPSDSARRIPNFIFSASTDPRVTALKADTQFTGDNLYDAIMDLCEPNHLGFRVSLNASNQFVFQLYYGEDRSYDQTKNPYVIFSPKFDNLVTSNFLEDVKELKTITLVAGEDEAHARRTQTVGYGSGLIRRELYTDARDIQSEYYDDEGEAHKVPDAEYNASLRQRGTKNISDYKFIRIFEGEVEAITMFRYGEHFYKGDIVQVETEYDVGSKMRIMQMVRTQDESGLNAYPVFDILDEDE